MNGVFGLVPQIDGQTVFSLIVGILVTVLTAAIGYRQTFGAREERARAASLSLASSVIRRVAVERAVLSGLEYEAIKRAKAYKAAVNPSSLLSFDEALDLAFADILDSDFLDANAKENVLQVISSSRETLPDAQVVPDSSPRDWYAKGLMVIPVAAGALAGVISSANTLGDLSSFVEQYGGQILGMSFVLSVIFVTFLLAYIVAFRTRELNESNDTLTKVRVAMRSTD